MCVVVFQCAAARRTGAGYVHLGWRIAELARCFQLFNITGVTPPMNLAARCYTFQRPHLLGTGPTNHVGEIVSNRSCGNGYRLLLAWDQQARRVVRIYPAVAGAIDG